MLKFFATVSGGPRAQKRDLSEEEKQEIAQQKRAREEEDIATDDKRNDGPYMQAH